MEPIALRTMLDCTALFEQHSVGALLEKAIASESPYSPSDSSQRSLF
jgi:hypothetical protein